MAEVTRPIISIMLVLCSVFVPVAFLSGVEGQFYRQFAITIAASTVISTLNSLTLSPALAALLLRPRHERSDFFQTRHRPGASAASSARSTAAFALLVATLRRAVSCSIVGRRRTVLAVFVVLLLGTWRAVPDRAAAASFRRRTSNI